MKRKDLQENKCNKKTDPCTNRNGFLKLNSFTTKNMCFKSFE